MSDDRDPLALPRLIPIDEFVEMPIGTSEYLLDGLIESGILLQSFGAPATLKSAFWLLLATCVATGKPFHGRKVKQGPVLYLAGEGAQGLIRRFIAIRNYLGCTFAEVPMSVCIEAPSLYDPKAAHGVIAATDQFREQYGDLALVVVDTMAKHITGGNEDKTQDTGQLIHHLHIAAPEATRVIIHHSGWSDRSRSRGSSGVPAAVDMELIHTVDDDLATVRHGKLKDGRAWESDLVFRVTPQSTGLCREDGSPLDSFVLVETDAPPPKPKRAGLGANQQRALDILRDLIEVDPFESTIVTEDDWREAVRVKDEKLASFKRWGELVGRLLERRMIRKHGKAISLAEPLESAT